jgi:iron complex outermembrane receptor protein
MLLITQSATAQDAHSSDKFLFSGHLVSGKDSRPVASAVITIVSTGKKIFSDSAGHFQIRELQKSKQQIRISSLGYLHLTKEISFPGNEMIRLTESEQELDQVVVTAVTGATKIKRTPVSIAIVSQKEMNKSTSSNVIDALLKSVPGISAITTGPNISKPFIRGLGYNRVLTLYDGIRQEGQQWGDEHGVEIDPYGIARAEVVKGPASLMYGSDAIAGVVNLIPGSPAESDGQIKGDAVTEYHSNNGMIGATIGLHYKTNGFLWSVRGSAKSAMDYQNKIDHRVYNTGYSEKNLSLMAGWENTKYKNYVQLNIYDNLQEIPDGSRDSLTRIFTYQINEADKDDIRNRPLVNSDRSVTYRIADLHQHIQHYRLYQKGIYTLGKGELSTLFGVQQNRRREYNHPVSPQQAGLYVQLTTFNYEVKYNFPEWAGIRFTYGINGMYQENRNKDATDFPIPDYRLFDIGTYLMAKKEFNKTVLIGGIRLDNRTINWQNFYSRKQTATGFMKQVFLPDTALATLNFPAYNRHFNGVSGSLGLVHTISNAVTFKANFATGYRSPSIPEIGSDGLDPGAHIYYIGNRNFQPEFNWQTDIGLFFTYPEADANIELFNNQINHYIFLQKLFNSNGQPLEIIPGNFTYAYKQGSARLYGAEANITLHPNAYPWLNVQNNVSMIIGINTDKEALKISGADAKYLPLIPPFRTVTRLRATLSSKKQWFSDAYLQTEIETCATQNKFYAVDNTETRTEGYTLVNIGAGISLMNKKGKSFCQLFINANNLFNIAYQSHQNRLKYFEYYTIAPNARSGIYNMGSNLAIKAIISW